MITELDSQSPDEAIETLRRAGLFKGLPADELRTVVELMKGVRAGPGDRLFEEGDTDDKFYVVAADIARRRPAVILERLVEFGRLYPLRMIAVESNHFQALLVGDLRKELADAGLAVHVQELNSQTQKQARIAALEPYVTQGRLLLSRRQHTLLEQLSAFPFGRHDDGPDALEMAVQAARGAWWDDRPGVIEIRPYRDH